MEMVKTMSTRFFQSMCILLATPLLFITLHSHAKDPRQISLFNDTHDSVDPLIKWLETDHKTSHWELDTFDLKKYSLDGIDFELFQKLDIKSNQILTKMYECASENLLMLRQMYRTQNFSCSSRKDNLSLIEELTLLHHDIHNIVDSSLIWNYAITQDSDEKNTTPRLPSFNPLLQQLLIEELAFYAILENIDYKVVINHHRGERFSNALKNFGKKTGHVLGTGLRWTGRVVAVTTDTFNPVNVWRGGNIALDNFDQTFKAKDFPISPPEVEPTKEFKVEDDAAVAKRLQGLEKVLILLHRTSTPEMAPSGFYLNLNSYLISGLMNSIQLWGSPQGRSLRGKPEWFIYQLANKVYQIRYPNGVSESSKTQMFKETRNFRSKYL